MLEDVYKRQAYQQDRDLLRFHYHRPKEIWDNLKDLDLPRRTFSSDLSQVPTVQHFITEDEIDAAMTSGSSFAGGKGRIYAFFMENCCRWSWRRRSHPR